MFPHPKSLKVEIIEVNGYCPTYQNGDSFSIEDGFQLVSSKPICLHAHQDLNAYYIPLSRGVSPYDLGLTAKDAHQVSNEAYIQCHDP